MPFTSLLVAPCIELSLRAVLVDVLVACAMSWHAHPLSRCIEHLVNMVEKAASPQILIAAQA